MFHAEATLTLSEDVVYMENDDERNEYVLNQFGRIWIGSKRRNYGRPWFFGQVCLLCSTKLTCGIWSMVSGFIKSLKAIIAFFINFSFESPSGLVICQLFIPHYKIVAWYYVLQCVHMSVSSLT